MTNFLLQYSGFTIAVVGFFLLSSGRTVSGNYVVLVADLILIVYGALTEQYGLLAANAIYAVIALYYIIKDLRK